MLFLLVNYVKVSIQRNVDIGEIYKYVISKRQFNDFVIIVAVQKGYKVFFMGKKIFILS